MKLQKLQPRLSTLNTSRVKVLDTKAGTTVMPNGRKWTETRKRIALAHLSMCAGCGLLWRSHIDQIDHKVPREQGGSNEDYNLQPLCLECHAAKTAQETKERFGKR